MPAETLLAGGAHQPPISVLAPARGERPDPVVGLAERGGVREPRAAASHVAPGGRDADLITNDTVLGDRDRVNQRIATSRSPVCPRVSWRTGGPQLSHPAGPAPGARPPCVLGTRLWAHPASPHRDGTQHISRRAPGAGNRLGLSGAGPRPFLHTERSTAAFRYARPYRAYPGASRRSLGAPERRSFSGDQLLAAVDVTSRAGDSGVRHEVHG